MARRVKCDSVRIKCTDIRYAQFVDQQLTKFEDARKQFFYLTAHGRLTRLPRHLWEVVANHGYTGGRRKADHLCATKNFQKMTHHGNRFPLIPGVVMHLAAAGLLRSELDGMAEPLEHSYDGLPGFRKQRIVVTSDKQRDEHRISWLLLEQPETTAEVPGFPPFLGSLPGRWIQAPVRFSTTNTGREPSLLYVGGSADRLRSDPDLVSTFV
jgi:hypothetical protein